MKAIKYIAQVLAAAALAFVAMWLLTRLMSWIFGWLLGLSNFWMLVVLFFGETVLIGIIISAASRILWLRGCVLRFYPFLLHGLIMKT